MSVTLAAGADAVGEDTLATAGTTLRVVDRGLLSYAVGSASLLAAAQTAPGGDPFASAYATFGVAGADYLSTDTSTVEGRFSDDTGERMVSGAQLDLFALDLKWLAFSIEKTTDSTGPAPDASLAGNFASFDASIEAYGDNGFTDLQADALALEEQLSSTVLSATAAVEGSVTYQRYVGSSRDNTIRTSADNALVEAGRGDDRITTSSGDDWVFGGDGRDRIATGDGDDTAFGQSGDDRIETGVGDDWLFGGRGDDVLRAGDGADLIFGGDDRDDIEAGAGNDVIDAGEGRDTVRGGAGDDVFRLGAERGDDDDRYWGGSGADLYLLGGNFDDDVIMDFSLAEGDRLLVGSGDWSSDSSLRLLNGTVVTLERARGDADDLVLTFEFGRHRSELTLDEFFAINSGYGALPRRGEFSDSQALPILRDLFGDDAGLSSDETAALLHLGSFLSDLG